MPIQPTMQPLFEAMNSLLPGKRQTILLSLTTLLAGGHLLLDDVPGVGKTTLAKGLTTLCGGSFRRIPFTPDLMPSDLTGYHMFLQKEDKMLFRKGLLEANTVLADEINRASPKTQSALLEAMDEGQITVDGETRKLPAPFFLVATRNPAETGGTYPLPTSQLDRFMMCLRLGYPSAEEETQLLRKALSGAKTEVTPLLTPEKLLALREQVQTVRVQDQLVVYIASIARASRSSRDLSLAISPRGSLALLSAARAYAFVLGRNYVTPEDIQTLLPFVLTHRLALRREAIIDGKTASSVLAAITDSVSAPSFT